MEAATLDPSKKRRGRKPKEAAASESAATEVATAEASCAASKRGRKPKAVFAFDSQQAERREMDEDDNVILKLSVQGIGGAVTAEGFCPDIDGECLMAVGEVGAYNESTMSNFSNFEGPVPHGVPANERDAAAGDHVSNVSKVGTAKVVELLKEFEEKSKNGEWPLTTSTACYWCCHRFDTPPVGLPCKCVNSRFHVTGCFCSLECAAAYNVMQLRDGLMEERMNLLNGMAREMGYTTIIKTAPPRQMLHMFGGNLTIDEFRRHHTLKKSINVSFPPMVVLISQLEEVNDSDVCSRLNYVPLDVERVDKYIEKIKLKRSLPVNVNNNTLENVMHFSIKQVV